jgi:hypothetical protein
MELSLPAVMTFVLSLVVGYFAGRTLNFRDRNN